MKAKTTRIRCAVFIAIRTTPILAAHAAQEENRRLGIPNVYSINGILYYELPNGELSREDPYDR